MREHPSRNDWRLEDFVLNQIKSTTATGKLSEALKDCADTLRTEPDKGAPLRKVQRLARSLLFSSEDSYTRGLAFILDEWIGEYYLNFAGDIFSPAAEDLERLRQALLREKVSSAFESLSRAVDSRNEADTLQGLQALAVSYLDTVKDARQFLGDW